MGHATKTARRAVTAAQTSGDGADPALTDDRAAHVASAHRRRRTAGAEAHAALRILIASHRTHNHNRDEQQQQHQRQASLGVAAHGG